jgi:hypothetical protein
MSYSPQLSYFLDRLSGFSTNRFKIMPQGSATANANNIIRITLPANSLVNFRTFALHFDAAMIGATGEGRLPNKIDSLIERVEVTFGGVQVSSGNNMYNVFKHAKDALMGDSTDPILGHPEVVRATSYHQSTNNGVNVNKEVSASYVVDKWEGFLGTVEPKIVDLSLLPECVVSIYLATNNVCIDADGTALSGAANPITTAKAAAAPVYELTNVYATIETIGLADGTYDSMVSQMMSQVGYLELPFKQYISFQDSPNGNMRFSVATQSLDRIWVAHRNANFDTVGGAVLVAGHKVSGAFTSTATIAATTAAGGAVTQDIGKPQFDIGGSLDYNKEKYVSKYFNFPQNNDSTTKYQLQLNGALFPQFQASNEDMFQISKESVLGGKHQMKYGLRTMLANYSVQCMRLNLCDSEFSRQISGLDTRGIALNGFYNIYNGTNGRPVSLFCEVTSTLRIGSGLSIEVIA